MNEVVVTIPQMLRRVRTKIFDFSRFARKMVAADIGFDPPCSSGCAWCCNAKVVMDGGHGAVLAAWLHHERRWTPELVAQLEAADREMAPVSHADWITKARPCVFLKATGPGAGKCTVYPVRPMGCYCTFARTADPRACGVPGGEGLALVSPKPDLAHWLVEEHEGLLNAAGESLTWLMTLPGAVLYGNALLMGTPRPDVFRVAKEDWEAAVGKRSPPRPEEDPESIENYFDRLASAQKL